jgi:ketosteroid isomerase-like protein
MAGTIELLERLAAAWNAADDDTLVSCVHPEVRFFLPRSAIEGPYVGREGVRRALQDARATWRELRVEPQELRDLGERAFTAARVHAVARDTGLTLDTPQYAAFRIDGGLVAEYRPFIGERGPAMAAAGIPDGSATDVARQLMASDWRGDIVELLHEDFDFRWSKALPGGSKPWRGPEGWLRAIAEWDDAWVNFRHETLRYTERGDEVLVDVRYTAHGRDSRIPFDSTIAQLWVIRDGKATAAAFFADPEKARTRWLSGDSPFR